MNNVIISFGDYPIYLDERMTEGPFNGEQLGIKWLDWVAELSPENIKRYNLIVVTPKKTVLPDSTAAWASLKRFDENSGVSGWPQGPNAVFKQIQWYYFHKRISGPFLWCEPDCVPIKPNWLDELADEYLRHYKPFMGGLVDVRSSNGRTQVPLHMTGNAIYPDKAYEKAPSLMEATNTPWDVYAAQQILRQAHITKLIQHSFRHPEIKTLQELNAVILPETVLFHSDKFGAIQRLLGRGQPSAERDQNLPRATAHMVGRPLVEVFERETAELKDLPRADLNEFTLPNILEHLRSIAKAEEDDRRAIATFMVQHNIVNIGHINADLKRKRKEKAANVLANSNP